MLAPNNKVWAPDYSSLFYMRQRKVLLLKNDAALQFGAREFYKDNPIEFIEDWCSTYDPRNAGTSKPTRMPFILFPRQKELVYFLLDCIENEENGLIEKCRDMGATWVCCAFSVWLWLFWNGASIGWGSRKEQLVDRLGDADSIFEKMRIIVNALPPFFLPKGFSISDHMSYMRFVNNANDSTITGEGGDNIGRGGRKLIYFKDESAHYERPEKIEAALMDNTRVAIDISSVNGNGNVFHRKREAGVEWQPGEEMVRNKTQVFIMDWNDHPLKDKKWFEARKEKAINDGLLHVFAQEVERNYSASVEGVVIPSDWVSSAIDAHKKLKFRDDGGWMAALDVADGGKDRNALAKRKGVILRFLDEWGDIDTGLTARKAIDLCRDTLPIEVQYDSVSVGAGVKSETNRLNREGFMPKKIRFVPWNGGAGVLEPDGYVEPDDEDTPKNEDFYHNLKAQGWWLLRRRFEKTHKAITQGVKYKSDELISLPSDLPKLRLLQKELSQPTASKSTSKLKLIIDKAPDGTRSPNLADAVMMCYHPVTEYEYTLDNL